MLRKVKAKAGVRSSKDPASPMRRSYTFRPRRRILSKIQRGYDHALVSEDPLENISTRKATNNQHKPDGRHRRQRSRSKDKQHVKGPSQLKNEGELELAARRETTEMKAKYGDLPLSQSSERSRRPKVSFENISSAAIGQEVIFTARLHVVRRMSQKLAFLGFRQQLSTLQGVVRERPGIVSVAMVHYAGHLRRDSIVLVRGTVQAASSPVSGCTIHDVELLVDEIHALVRQEEPAPFSVYEAEMSIAGKDQGDRSHVPHKTRLANRILDLRTPTSQSIFRIQSALSRVFRSSLSDSGFLEVHTPKLQGSETVSGAPFKLNYFNRDAFLAQNSQFAKQMAIIADFDRVYEIGPAFRAESSNTHRHLTEYTGLDLEMVISEHYHEMMEVVDEVVSSMLQGVYSRYRREVDIVKRQFPSDDLVWLNKTPVIRFSDGVAMLNNSGWRTEDGKPLSVDKALHSRDEIRLGELVKEEYNNTDYYILDKFPISTRPFYTMPDAEDSHFSNSFDMFIRGRQVASAGQRIHDASMLEERMCRVGIVPESMEEYIRGFRYGASPHAGASIGLERLLMLILELGDIRSASHFYRDPRSFSFSGPVRQLRHPESSTLEPPWQRERDGVATDANELQPLEHLIANYGDTTSTSFLDGRFRIWRDTETGAAVSYVPSGGNYVVVPGNPLCDTSQYPCIVARFLQWLRQEKYKPIWVLCSAEIEAILGKKLGWRTFSPIAEQRVDPSRNLAALDGEIARKVRHAKSEGVKLVDVGQGQMVSDDVRKKIDQRIQDWSTSRNGTQVHLSQISPWRDYSHRWYFYAIDKSGEIGAFVTLAMLSFSNGMHVKYSLDFPGAANGTIEWLITEAIQTAARAGVDSFAFGAGAIPRITAGHNMRHAKINFIQHTYEPIAKRFSLLRKSEFRAKFGAREEPLYLAYPSGALGSKGIQAIFNFFQS